MLKFQKDVAEWHQGKYPNATLSDVTRKFAEESGELVRALNRLISAIDKNDWEEVNRWKSEVRGEMGDVEVTLATLAERYLRCYLDAVSANRFYLNVQKRP